MLNLKPFTIRLLSLIRLTFLVSIILILSPNSLSAATLSMSDGFDFPVGKPGGMGFYDAQDFGERSVIFRGKFHLGEDWNKNCNGDCDKNEPVFSISNGVVKFSRNKGLVWGRVIIIEHELPNGTLFYSQYGHLNDFDAIPENTVVQRGQQIGSIRGGIQTNFGYMYAHLHLEIRTNDNPKKLDPWLGYSVTPKPPGWVDPSDFISSHRPLVSDPINLTIAKTTSTSITLNWTKPTFKNFDHYELYRSTEQGGTSDPQKRINILKGNEAAKNIETTSFTDSNLSPNTLYYYSLFAFDINGFFVSSNEISASASTGIKNITQNPYDQRDPRIHGKYVTWNDWRMDEKRNGIGGLYIYDIEKDELRVFDTTSAGSKYVKYPYIYGSKVVFEERRGMIWSSESVFVYDIESYGGRGSGFMAVRTSCNCLLFPQIYKDIIVWQEYKNKTLYDIYYLDLSSGWQGPVPLAKEPGQQLSPSIWERKVVYISSVYPYDSPKVVLVDIDTKERTVLFEGGSIWGLSIDSGIITWIHNNTIYYYDIENKTTSSFREIEAFNVITKERKLIYGRAGTPASIHIYDLATKKDIEVVRGFKYYPLFDYSNGVLVYQDHTEYDTFFYDSTDILMVRVE